MWHGALEARARRWTHQLLPVYHRLPWATRHLMTSARGWPLARLRRSGWTRAEAALGAGLERDPAAAARVATMRLRVMLRHAADTVPHYTRLFRAARFDPATAGGPEGLRRLPILERDELKERWRDFQSRAVSDARAIFTHTSGTSGAGLTVRATPEAYARAWAQQLRHWRWGGMRSGEWRVTLFGAEVIPRLADANRLWVYNLPERQIFLSAYHLAPRHAERYRRFLERRPRVVEGFPSVLLDLALLLGPARPGRRRARTVFTTGEALSPAARATIEQAFGACVLDQYGMDEKVGYILQCPSGTYHQLVEFGVLEIVDDRGESVPPGVEGHLVWTGLVNDAMPLVRYRIGDEGAWVMRGPCSCGVAYPAVAPTLTRSGDSLRLAGGRRVSPRLLNQMLKECETFAAAQFVQRAADRVTILVEPRAAAEPTAREAAALAARLEGQFGGAVSFRPCVVERIAREPSAKRKLVVVERDGQEAADAADAS